MKAIPRFLTIFLLFGLPFVILPFGTSQFEIPKVIAAQLAIELFIVVSLFTNHSPTLQKKARIPYTILFLASVLAMLLFPSRVAFFGNQFRLQGVFLFWHLLLFGAFVKRDIFSSLPGWVVPLFLIVQAAGVVIFGTNDVSRAYGFLGEPNALAASGVFALPLLFFMKQKKQLFFFGFFLCLIIIIASGSRSGLFAAFLEVALLVASQRFPMRTKQMLIGCFVLFGVFLLSSLFFSDPHESRVEIWHAALLAFFAHPVIGGGVGNAELLLHTASLQFASFISARYVDSSHNIFFDMLIELGGVGFLAFVALIFFAFRSFLQRNNNVSVAMLLGMIVVLSFNPGSVWELVVLWYVIGTGVTDTLRQGSE